MYLRFVLVLKYVKLLVLTGDLSDPVQVVRYPGINARYSGLATSDPPRNNASQLPTALSFADHRTTAVALASILSFFTAGADESWV